MSEIVKRVCNEIEITCKLLKYNVTLESLYNKFDNDVHLVDTNDKGNTIFTEKT